jgi:hypothetical protein
MLVAITISGSVSATVVQEASTAGMSGIIAAAMAAFPIAPNSSRRFMFVVRGSSHMGYLKEPFVKSRQSSFNVH